MARDPHSETTLTSRGIGMAAVGVVVGGLGVGLATPPLVYVGVAMCAAVAVAALWMLLSVNSFLSSYPFAHREITPRPLTVGVVGRVTVTMSAAQRGRAGAVLRRAIAQSLDIREQAAAELTGGGATKATVARTSDSLSLSYALHPTRRGRWPLGPALVHSSDPLGMIWADTAVGGTEEVAVWPHVIDLSGTAGALMGHADRIVLGARTPSADDAALRDYREGDDLRRVHWPSSARTGTMLVRSDERAGKRPATVIIDPPLDAEALEWAVSSAASIAISVLDSGHPVRLFGGTISVETATRMRSENADMARVALLNSTVDIASAASRDAAEHELSRASRHATDDLTQGEVIIAVLEPHEGRSLAELVPLGEAGHAWAVVRDSDEVPAAQTALALRRAGWRVAVASMGDDLAAVWMRLVASGDAP